MWLTRLRCEQSMVDAAWSAIRLLAECLVMEARGV